MWEGRVQDGGCDAADAGGDGVLSAVRGVWGFDELRPLQREAIGLAVAGRDGLVVLPTGGGKSLCYQAPPLVTGGLTLVISPLIALMKDQVDGLRLNGYPAAALHSQCGTDEIERAWGELRDGSLRLLLTSPERAVSARFVNELREAGVRPGAIAVDEAHCISQWGHDFRPEYRQLAGLRRWFPGVAMQAFTATATPRVREDIVEQLGLRDPVVLVGDFDRPNLTYRVVHRSRPVEQILAALSRHEGEAAIVYCMSRRQTEELADTLRRHGIDAGAYHAGLDGAKRTRVQDDFIRERLRVVVATVAFGMGIDRSDVRLVAHASMPKSVEAYQQEAGRAGRDGLPAECLLLLGTQDAGNWERLIRRSAEESGVGAEVVEPQVALVREMRRFATRVSCRHRLLCEHFGQRFDRVPCGACDVCLGETEPVGDAVLVSRKILSAVARTGQRFGVGHIAGVLRGKRDERMVRLEHDRLPTFGALSGMSSGEIRAFVDQLIDQDVLARDESGEYPTVCFGARGMAVMRGEDASVQLARVAGSGRRSRERAARRGGVEARPLGPDERAAFDALKSWRRELAEERQVPPYVIFSDATLREIVLARPRDVESLLEVKGIGERKREEFGEAVLGVLRSLPEL
ncbi:MAG: RecQ family ATP-dependent DNA helicase [Phycisphaerales bacterium]